MINFAKRPTGLSFKQKRILLMVLLTLLLPFLGSFIMGEVFSGHVIQHVPTAIVDHENSTFSRELIRMIASNEAFNVTAYPSSNEALKSALDASEVAAGIIIPADFSKDLRDGNLSKIMVVYDGTQMSMTGTAKARITEILMTIRSGYMTNVMQGKLGIMPGISKNYVMPMPYATRLLGNPTRNTSNYMVQGMLLNVIQLATFILGIELIENSKKRYSGLYRKSLLAGLVGTFSVILAIGLQYILFGMPFRGHLAGALMLTLLYMTGMGGLGVLTMTLKNDRLAAVGVAGALGALFMLSGYTYPLIAMPAVFQKIAFLNPFLHYGIPMRDLSLTGITTMQLLCQMGWLVLFVIVVWAAMFKVCRKIEVTN